MPEDRRGVACSQSGPHPSVQTDRKGCPYAPPSLYMARAGGAPRAQRCPLHRPLARRPSLSPPQSSVSLFITLNTVLWIHE
jgi:hypothetical protein